MEKTNQLVEQINQIFDVIDIIYDKTDFTFDRASVLIQKFELAMETSKKFDVKGITMEIWDATSKIQREENIVHLMNYKFDRLLTWKPNLADISVLNLQLPKDLDFFYTKQAHINRHYNPMERTTLERFYTGIAHRLYKANNDMDKVMEQLMKMTKEEASGAEGEQLLTLKLNNFKLHPERVDEFCTLIEDLYDKKFFIPVDNSIPYSKTELFKAFSDWFHTNLLTTPAIQANSKSIDTSKTIPNGKYFAEYLLHPDKQKLAEEIRKEFSTEKGKAIRLLLHVLGNYNPPLIAIGYRQGTEIYNAMTLFFERNIGSYQGIFNYKVDVAIDRDELEKISIRLNHILSNI